MSEFPTIFDWLSWAEPLRGFPASYLLIAAAAVVVAVWDWRVALFALAAHYLLAGLLFVDILDPRLAVVKILVGLFICLMLYVTARQVTWGKPPPDVTPEELLQLQPESYLALWRFRLAWSTLLRLRLVIVSLILVFTVGQRATFSLPFVPPAVNLAIYGLLILGIVGMAITTEPLKAGMALLLFMTGFELLFSAFEQSVATLVLLGIANLVIALAISYLTQARHAAYWQLDDS